MGETSGKIYGDVTSNSDKFKFFILWSATQNISKNYSDVTVTSYWEPQDGWETWDFDTASSRNASITINGSTESISKRFYTGNDWSNGNPYLIQTVTKRVYHNDDGSKSIKISARANGRAADENRSYGPSSSTESYGDCTVFSEDIPLKTIPRASSITFASDITLGNPCNITWTPASTDFKYKIKFSLGDWYYITDYILPSTTSAYTYNEYEISGTEAQNNTTIYKELPESISGTMIATLTTYNSSEEQIGLDASKEFTVIIPDSIIPTIGSVELKPMGIEGFSHNFLVQNKNGLNVIIKDCIAGEGSEIKSYEVLGPSLSKIEYTSDNGTTITFSSVETCGTLTYTIKVTDARDRTSSILQEIECYEYYIPSFKSFNAYRSNENGELDMNGAYLKCEYSINYAPVNSTNSVVVTIYYNDSSIESDEPIDLNGDTTTTYKVHAKVIDAYGKGNSSSIITVFGETRILNVTKDGTSIAIGKMAEDKPDGYEGMFECRWPAKFDGSVTIPENDTGGPVINDYSVGTLGPDKEIPENADLDDYITPGVFSSNNGSISATIGNTPYKDSGFKLTVEYLGTKWHIRQTVAVRTKKGLCYTRYGEYKDGSYVWEKDEQDQSIWRVFLNDYNCGDYTVTPTNCGNYTLTPTNYSNYTSPKPVVLYNGPLSAGAISLHESASNYSYIEIFFTDNNGFSYNSTKIVAPNGKCASLSLIDPGGSPEYTYVRRTNYIISETTITPNITNSGYVRIDNDVIGTADFGTNYIKIVKVLGYK